MGQACDICAVTQTLYRYCRSYDDHNIDVVLECFTEDAVMESIGFPSGGRYEGRAELADFFNAAGRQPWVADWFGGAQGGKHLALNPVIDVDGDTATSSTDWMIFSIMGAPKEGDIVGRLAGRYHDELRRVGDRWLISHRRMIASIPGVPQEYNEPHVVATAS